MFARDVCEIRKNVKIYEQAWAEEAHKAPQSQLPLWVVLGDSMSQGIGASEFRKGWVGQARDILHRQKKDYAIINLSKSGAMIEDVLRDQISALEVLRAEPAAITLLVGSNDLFSLKSRTKLLSNLTILLDSLPEGTIVGDIFHRPNTPMPLRKIFAYKAASDLLQDVANRRKLIVVPLDEAFKTPWRDKLAADYYHPNDQGYEGIALAFIKAMREK